MELKKDGHLLRIFIGESHKYKGKPLYERLVATAREMGLAGATVFRGIMGYGANSRIHSSKILRLSQDLPIVIEIVDTQENVDRLLPKIDSIVPEGLITMEKVRVLRYAPAASGE